MAMSGMKTELMYKRYTFALRAMSCQVQKQILTKINNVQYKSGDFLSVTDVSGHTPYTATLSLKSVL